MKRSSFISLPASVVLALALPAWASYAAPSANDASRPIILAQKEGGGGGRGGGGGPRAGGGGGGGGPSAGGGGGGPRMGGGGGGGPRVGREGGGPRVGGQVRRGGDGPRVREGGGPRVQGRIDRRGDGVREPRGSRGDGVARHRGGNRPWRSGKRFLWGPGLAFYFYDGYYYGDCSWLRRKARETGSAYWWTRYRQCREAW